MAIQSEKITALEKKNEQLTNEVDQLKTKLDAMKNENLLLPYKIKESILIELEKKK